MVNLGNVNLSNCRLIWEWANDPDARAASFSSQPIPWEEHVRWFQAKLEDPQCLFYLASNERGEPIGQIRHEMHGSESLISISLDAKLRGHGYGTEMIRLSCSKIFELTEIRSISAFIKPDNNASVQAFLKAGFNDLGIETYQGKQAVHLVCSRKGNQ
jgi:UDP-2,4-diacetamido-2,4,6-trideoxy-beta-L-altropyranose hydrolase